METIVIRIPGELARDLEAEAERLQITKSEVARRRLAAPLDWIGGSPGFHLIADLVGTVEGGPTDMSRNRKQYLKSTGYGKARRAR